MTNSTHKSDLDTPGKRLKHVRSLLRLSRSYIQEKYHLPEVTLKSWENGTSKLTSAGAERCVEVYKAEGLIINEDWIIEGLGLDPKAITSINHYFSIPTNKELPLQNDEIAMIQEANTFKENYPNAVVLIVSNDDMRPYYKPGDYVGGKLRSSNELEFIVNKDCIVYLKNGDRFFRRLIRSNNGGYNLTTLNPNESTSEPVLFNVDIDKAAPVIWHRWKDE